MTNKAIWSRDQRTIKQGSEQYWRTVVAEGLPSEDWNTATCEGDSGYGPCGTHTDWSSGHCSSDHEIEFGGRN